jgi:hypothetical protein
MTRKVADDLRDVGDVHQNCGQCGHPAKDFDVPDVDGVNRIFAAGIF